MILLLLAAMFIGGLVLLDEGDGWSPQSVVGALLVLTVAAVVVLAILDKAQVTG